MFSTIKGSVIYRIPSLWKASVVAFISSFCVMVVELIAGRILAPHIGVSLYTWTSIIGTVLAGIALGNYVGGRLADRYGSPLVLATVFFVGALATIAILPTTKLVTSADWFSTLPLTLNFTMKAFCIFFLPAVVLSMVSPMVIKLALADLEQTGSVVGTVYAFSTLGAILGTFMTGFYLILWFGTGMIVWVIAGVLMFTGMTTWFAWRVPDRWVLSLKSLMLWIAIVAVVLISIVLFHYRVVWQEGNVKESNYYSIRIFERDGNVKVLCLDNLIHSSVVPDKPTELQHYYLEILAEMVKYVTSDVMEDPTPRVLHLGGGGYSFPRYMEAVYPGSVNDVVEIDPAVTQVAHEEMGLPLETDIRTYNKDARLFLIERKTGEKYNIVIGDAFNSLSTPYHLTTLEFGRLVKANMEEDGIYLVNIIDNYERGKYLPSFIHTLKQVFNYVYLLGTPESWDSASYYSFIIVATDHNIDLASYRKVSTEAGSKQPAGSPLDEIELNEYLSERDPILLTDDYAPTDILVTSLFQ